MASLEEYQDYILNSKTWDNLRIAALKRSNFTCEYCGANKINSPNVVLQVHHTQSAKLFKLGNEPLTTLKVLCKKDHDRYHLLGKLLNQPTNYF